jgi:hypothetical protein
MRKRNLYRFSLMLIPAALLVGTVQSDESTKGRPSIAAADDLVRESLRSELAGDNRHRDQMLAQALKASPDSEPANWHSGRVMIDGQWQTIDDAQRRASDDKRLALYREIRQRANLDPSRLVVLARWCAREGLEERSRLHFRQLLDHPTTDARARNEAMRKLGLRNYDGALLTEQEIQQQGEVAEQIEDAMKRWRPRLADWQRAIDSDNRKHRDYAVRQMEQVDDPHIIPVLETVIADAGLNFGRQAVALLGRFHEYEATEALVRYALFASPPSVRQAAVGELTKRSLHDFAPMLLNALVSPIQSRWRVVWDPDGNVRYQHLFYRDGQRTNQMLATDHLAAAQKKVVGEENVGPVEPDGRNSALRGVRSANPAVTRRMQQLHAAAAAATAARREHEIAMANAMIQGVNQRVYEVLETTSGTAVPRNPADWWYWWEKYNESVKPKPTEYVYLPSKSSYVREVVAQYERHSCFVAGTAVWTETGQVPIQDVQVGDRVLSQDPNTGELAFKLVQRVTAGAAASDLAQVTIDGQTVYCTLGHVMWVNGQGWRIAKRLTPADRVHGISGALVVESVTEMPSPPVVHNLIVDDFHTYFVGEQGMLVHDITYRQPTRAVVPGLLEEETALRVTWNER